MGAVKALRRRNEPTVPSTMELERATNVFLRADDPEVRSALGLLDADAREVFAELRARKDRF